MRTKLYLAIVVWLGLVGLSLAWNYNQAVSNHQALALMTARSFFKQIVITRVWNLGHGGVYVPVTDQVQPNPYLEDPQRDLYIDGQLRLTRINPAYMTRQISELAAKEEGVRFSITSLIPLRPANRPTPRQEQALGQFDQGASETSAFIQEDGRDVFFYMAPLITEEHCLGCHARQGRQVGQVRGGISVTMPFAAQPPLSALYWGHLLIALLGAAGIAGLGSQLARAYEKLQHQAVIDALTGIPNRRSFTEHLLREFASSRRYHKPISVIMCDIDHFKGYNDHYGHAAGDECLHGVAQAIKRQMQRPHDFCARYGGEEFIIILQDTAQEGAMHVAERIRQAILELKVPHQQSPPAYLVSLSMGVATAGTDDPIEHQQLVERADKALYAAKAGGRNRAEFFAADPARPA